VLSIGKLTDVGSAGYYEHAVASGREDYYSGRGEAAGEWVGDGAEALGLAGEVPEGALERLLAEGAHPVSGESLRATAGSVVGFDLTFSAPKSVSVLYAAGDFETRQVIVAGHEAAVRQALGYLEREAVQVRRGRNGVVKEHAGGLIAAAYRHRTSRAGDPQLHTHVVAANFARGSDGRYTALHGAALYTHAKTAGYLCQAALRAELTRELAVEWTPVAKGFAEIKGIPEGVLVEFSQRRAEILERMAALGATSASAARVAALDTRRAKEYRVGDDIYAEWQARAAEHGLDRASIAAVLDRHVERPVDIERAAAFMAGETGLTAQASTFSRREVLQAWCEHYPQGAPISEIEQLCARWLASDLVLQVDGVPVGMTPLGRRVAATEPRYTTVGMLAAEDELLERADNGRASRRGVAGDEAVGEALEARSTIRAEQAAMVRQLCGSGDLIEAVRGRAGTGKTFALDAAADAWRRSGTPVAGVALSGKAADILRDETAIHTSTIAQLFAAQDRYGDRVLQKGQVLIVDEAGMVGTRDLTRLADMVDRARGKLVLIGDTEQLSEIDAGGAFRALVERQAGVELTEVTRQQDPQALAQLEAIRTGRAHDALLAMRDAGNLVLSPTAEHTRTTIVADWHQSHQRAAVDGPAFMVAKRNADVRDLNHRARDTLLDHDQLSDDAVILGGRELREGERVIAGTNDHRIGVRNGTTATLERIDHDSQTLHVRTDRDTRLQIPFDYAAGRTREGRPHLDYAYAVTVHRAQGDTWGAAHYLGGEDTFRQEAYTALSRARHTHRFYAATPDLDPSNPEVQELAELDPLARALGRDNAKTLALDTLDQSTAERLHADEIDRHARTAASLEKIDHSLATTADPDRRAQLHRVRTALIARAGDPAEWAAAHRPELAQVADERRQRAHRQHVATHRTIVDPPAYITAAIGDPPADPAGHATWNRAALLIERHRRDHAPELTADTPGLGPRPSAATYRPWQQATMELNRLTQHVDRRVPVRDRAPDIGIDR
jgi:conjugative relaxase-like TrwC/TraI family protein